MIKKALIFNPYLDTLGGGEFYSLLVGEFLFQQKFSVEIAWPEKSILEKIYLRFSLDFEDRIKVNKKAFSVLKKKGNLVQKYLLTKDYQLIFFVSDGSIPLLFAKNNWLLFQSPFINIQGRSIFNQGKLKKINQVISYSNFVKKFIDEEFKVCSQVIYPTVSSNFFELNKIKDKENIILSVGRFDQILNAKKQDVLVKAFKKLVDDGLKDWSLVLLGGLMEENQYFKKLKQLTKGYPVKIVPNVSFKTLFDYYKKAKIYWHAAGFSNNLEVHPERAEHFGISVVEAMVSGAVPLVFKGGGVSEIVRKEQFLWESLEELNKKTNKVIKNDSLMADLRKDSIKRGRFFTKQRMFSALNKLL
ncbi:hypothetical protein COT75_01845 [Candidatus Beckwithbacteria bacterium CG10_big_fil_rev_8_21_14_0_10_34_10]|uniref:Glycosyl transferase family 1 domain-containing protein n=1 Tax=Candidatus Beckwithbacteria bacterium CG10_big_fil_rev_8_21_14_0_10_34_10 TaxID=1974495 RepID=A0A2H0W9R5_9BACT|nr:MAG: hypothetical protein COT75_01845 [Candidatus Beckwithbacteria bacterium CG10_big_fil_rev_8_21_14_0_10_34_10]